MKHCCVAFHAVPGDEHVLEHCVHECSEMCCIIKSIRRAPAVWCIASPRAIAGEPHLCQDLIGHALGGLHGRACGGCDDAEGYSLHMKRREPQCLMGKYSRRQCCEDSFTKAPRFL